MPVPARLGAVLCVVVISGCAVPRDTVTTETEAIVRGMQLCGLKDEPWKAERHGQRWWAHWADGNGVWINASDGQPSMTVGPGELPCLFTTHDPH